MSASLASETTQQQHPRELADQYSRYLHVGVLKESHPQFHIEKLGVVKWCSSTSFGPPSGGLSAFSGNKQRRPKGGRAETDHSAGRSESQYGRHGKDSSDGLHRIQPLAQKPPGNGHANCGRQSDQGRDHGR